MDDLQLQFIWNPGIISSNVSRSSRRRRSSNSDEYLHQPLYHVVSFLLPVCFLFSFTKVLGHSSLWRNTDLTLLLQRQNIVTTPLSLIKFGRRVHWNLGESIPNPYCLIFTDETKTTSWTHFTVSSWFQCLTHRSYIRNFISPYVRKFECITILIYANLITRRLLHFRYHCLVSSYWCTH